MNIIGRRVILILTVLTTVLSNFAYAQDKGKGGNEAITELYNAAKKEGTVIIWGPTDAIIYQRMQAYLDKQYPGIKIQHFESIPEPLGFDPEPHYGTIQHPYYGLLKFTPWRVELGNLWGEPVVWRP